MFRRSGTGRLQRRTVARLAVGLGVTENWLLHGLNTEQLGIWPRAIEGPKEDGRTPADVLQDAVAALVQIDNEGVQTQLARGALLGMLEVAGVERVHLPNACYAALVWLEEHREVA
jgi:hypothetical protein